MAKDDYESVVFRILTYYYAILKRKAYFELPIFNEKILGIDDGYASEVLRLMQNDGLIEGAIIAKAWGNVYILATSPADIKITSAGISYLHENSTMKKLTSLFKETVGIIGDLVRLVIE